MASSRESNRRGSNGLLAIALFKLAKGVALIFVTIGAVTLFHKNVESHAEHWIDVFRIDPDNRYIAAALRRLNLVHTRELKELSFLTAFYAALFLIEGTGLALRKRWAEYLTIVATALFIPLEIYEICTEASVMKVILLLGNVAIVAFLIYIVRNNSRT